MHGLLLLAALLVAHTTHAHVLITTLGRTDMGTSPLCASLPARLPFNCTIATVADADVRQTCAHLNHCVLTHIHPGALPTKTANIREQEARALRAHGGGGSDPWMLVLTPTYRLAHNWHAELLRMVATLDAGVCVIGACMPLRGVLDHVNHKALYSAPCYHRLRAATRWWEEEGGEPADVAFTNALLESDERFVCDPRFNGHLRAGRDDLFFRTDGAHHTHRVYGEYPQLTNL